MKKKSIFSVKDHLVLVPDQDLVLRKFHFRKVIHLTMVHTNLLLDGEKSLLLALEVVQVL